MSHKLRPIVSRRGYAVGAAQARLGSLFYAVLLVLACAGVAAGTVAMADVVRAVARAS